MKKLIKLFIVSFLGLFIITGTIGVVLAATYKPDIKSVADSSVPPKVYKQELVIAEAQTLKTTTTNVSDAIKDKSFHQLVKTSGLSPKNYKTSLYNNLINDLEAKGYSHDKIVIAIEQKTIDHLKAKLSQLTHYQKHHHKVNKTNKK